MKKAALSVSLFLIALTAYTQSVTLDISGGYCIPLASGMEPAQRVVGTAATFPTYFTTYARMRKKSYGQGGNVSLNLNWYSKKDIGFGIKLNLFFGSTPAYKTTVKYNSDYEYYTYLDKPFSFQFIPHLCFKRDFKVVTPVIEAGMIIAATEINQRYTITTNYSPYTINTTTRDQGGAMLGFYSSVGLLFNISKVVQFNLSMNCTAGSYSPTKWRRIKFTVDGQDQLSSLSTNMTEGRYVKELDLRASQSANGPSRDLKFSAPFSSIGINVGFCFKLGKQTKKKKASPAPSEIHPY